MNDLGSRAILTRGPRLLQPGLANFAPGRERYRVPGSGLIVVELGAGDEMTVTDTEGMQVGEVAAFDAAGQPSTAALSTKTAGPARGIQGALSRSDEAIRLVRAGLKRRGIDIAKAEACRLFSPDGKAGESASFVAEKRLTVIIAAPGVDMAAADQNPPTDLSVVIQRAVANVTLVPPLPEPLAEPRFDARIDRCTAQAYEVRAGEYIQIIDVAGRQCSDFLAFAQRQLDHGQERGLDATTTRTLMGASYPGPGLFSKFYDQDMQPLVEVVRDTVGRHDTFALACTAKYYDDMGYPGHANCSDNFNGAVEAYGIAARRGWPAVNFFYNTGIDANNVLYLDEPWSRPGDYVLLRALTDLVCASSACPDDIDAANGWNPTDIHLRVYPEKNIFSKAVAYRMTAESDPQLTKETGFHPRTSALTRQFAEYRGYWLPNKYTDYGVEKEYWACREAAIVMDLSALRKFEILGPDAEELMNRCLTRNVRKLSVGQVVYTAMCYEHGGMIDDGTLYRLGPDNFRWIGGDDYGGIWLRERAQEWGLRVWIKSSTDQLHNISVQGPKSREILKEIVWTPAAQPNMEELQWFRFAVARIGDHNGIPLVVSRTGYTGELGYEIFCHPKHAPGVWDAVWEAGRPQGLAPLGLTALDMLRIESGLIFAGYEFDDQTDPFEAGIGFTVPLKSKEEDFVGKAAILRRKENPRHQLVGLELAGNEAAAHGDCVHVGRAQVGVITSGTRSPILRKNIALCRIDANYATAGTEVEVGKIDGHQKRLPAVVAPFPFYDPEKKRPRS